MAYTPTTWNDGDVITAEKMNKLEQGIKDNVGYQRARKEIAEQQEQRGKKVDPGTCWSCGSRAIHFLRRIKRHLVV